MVVMETSGYIACHNSAPRPTCQSQNHQGNWPLLNIQRALIAHTLSPCLCSPELLRSGPSGSHQLSGPKICCREEYISLISTYTLGDPHSWLHSWKSVASSPVSHSTRVRLDDKGFMSPSLFQLSNVVAEGVVLSWQYPRARNKVILLLVNSTHPAGGCKSQTFSLQLHQVVHW